jgi:hypothetical protein
VLVLALVLVLVLVVAVVVVEVGAVTSTHHPPDTDTLRSPTWCLQSSRWTGPQPSWRWSRARKGKLGTSTSES